ncbi:MAG: hypothetical protein ABIJ61_13675 [bacterium]
MRNWIVVILVILSFSAAAFAVETAEGLVAKNLAARGGLENLQKLTSLRATGKNMLPGGSEVPMVILQKRPQQFRLESNFNGHTTTMGSDGKQAWRTSALGGAHPMDTEQALVVQLQTDFDGVLLDYKERGYKLELVGDEELGAAVVYHLKLTHPDLADLDVYLDANNYLEKSITATRMVGDNPWTVSSFFADYRELAGVKVPYAIQVRTADRVAADIRIDKIEANVPLDDSLFKMPASKIEE